MRTAIVTGLTGMDGSLLADQLLDKEYRVFGLIRRSSRGLDLGCASHLEGNSNLEVVEGDLLDLPSLVKLCKLAKADLFFSMGAQSHVGSSFDQPIYTFDCTGKGPLHCLEAIRESGIHTRFLQASTSELFGGISPEPANENTQFHPRSPYGIAKLAAYWTTVHYREAYKMFACNTICFNHEHFRRGPNFVTRKIAIATARIAKGLQDKLYLGNLDAKRDWGWAADFTSGMISILESNQAEDYILATGEAHSVREFCDIAFARVGLSYKDFVNVDPRYYRPCEVDTLIGDASKIKEKLGWEPTVKFEQLVHRMVDYELSLLD